MGDVVIESIHLDDVQEILEFTDKWIGKNYFEKEQLIDLIQKGHQGHSSASFKAIVDGELAGVRLTLAPGNWISDFSKGLSFDLWNLAPESLAYFKSLFVSEKFQKMGIGKKLSTASINSLKEMGASGILCHSWLESPGNSSQKYLQSFDFKEICVHEAFWSDIDYDCTRCSPSRCQCSAAEMLKIL